MIWIKRLAAEIERWSAGKEDPRIVITDVRYLNEVQWIIENGGVVYRIVRPGYGPANTEEASSFRAIEMSGFRFPRVDNCSTPEELGKTILEVTKSLFPGV